jgi:hypothetical protein
MSAAGIKVMGETIFGQTVLGLLLVGRVAAIVHYRQR